MREILFRGNRKDNGEWIEDGFENCGNFIPAEDAVEVVRCKDCRYLMFSDCYGECKQNHLGIVRPDDYCSYGERKDGDKK